jgi:predicted metal-dependent hydrolase
MIRRAGLTLRYLWGRRYLLAIHEVDRSPAIELKHARIVLHVRRGANQAEKHATLQAWYRDELKRALPKLIAKWELILGVKVERFFLQHMKTKWGSCNHSCGNIRLNTELAKKPRECLEYVVAHEMIHLLEPTHNKRFVALLNRYMPRWQFHRQTLNRLPLSA